ncbi:uncharacterized protein LOC134209168 [Armigeres subalbatus]|uniref:uncharacterized protein LOC134209168 n=1 Tax=Armigeres subalbatus TaxID=124917 RepID=UPI002ECFE179
MEPSDYVMQVVTYPTAVDAIRRRQYVDDMLTSVDTVEEAVKLANDVCYIHRKGGFHMRNWVSNSPAVLKALGENPKSEKSMEMNAELAMEKIQGLIAHYLMYLKLLLQEIWRAQTGWDETIGQKHLEKWLTWLRILPELESVRIPRCYFLHNARIDEATVELHTFVDASESGFAAVSFFRFEIDDNIECVLVGSKTRVAPIKFVSIPRLELQAAVVGARLARSIVEGHSINIAHRYFWTDARDVMCWLQSDHRRYSQFVAFRVGEILETTDIAEWRWLGTKHNVADDGTKWKFKPDLKPTSRWFVGPPFLWKPKSEWPVSSLQGEETYNEIRANLLHHIENKPQAILLPENYSSWQHLRRVTAFVKRFIENIKRKKNRQPAEIGPLTSEELSTAEVFQFQRAQEDAYGEELAVITDSRRLKKKNRLYKVNPFIDDRGVMRIHSRLGECDFVDESDKYPIVLPRDHPTTRLIVSNVHQRYHHQCHETCVNEVRKQFYIPRVRRVCDQVRRECQSCLITSARPEPPAMGPLQKARVAALYVHSHTWVWTSSARFVLISRRHEKRWGLIVTCLTTRAIHLELAASLSTKKELKAALAGLDLDMLTTEFTTPATSWRFNPPASPHMGGSWERLIQSVKKILAAVKPQRVPTEEVLRSYLIQAENIVNSRPLTHVPVDDVSSPALTPTTFC